MIAEVFLPKSALDMSGKEVAELYDEERQGQSKDKLAANTLTYRRARISYEITRSNPGETDDQS